MAEGTLTPNLLKTRAGLFLSTFALVWFVIFNLFAIGSGVPLGVLYGKLIPLSGIQLQFTVTVSPTMPLYIGQTIIVTVQDKNSLQPVSNATVSISLNSEHLADLITNKTGQVSFEYPGEATIILVSKSIYTPLMKVYPHEPQAWVSALGNDLIASSVGGVISGLVVDKLKRKGETKSKKRTRRRARKRTRRRLA